MTARTNSKGKRRTRVALFVRIGFFFVLAEALVFSFSLYAQQPCPADSFTDNQIADAIYLAEGAERAIKPFGILSVKCEGYNDCRCICLNTIRNNRKRYADWGYKLFPTYLEFLASRYAPIGASNDPKNLNVNWLKNVRWFLKNEKKTNS